MKKGNSCINIIKKKLKEIEKDNNINLYKNY